MARDFQLFFSQIRFEHLGYAYNVFLKFLRSIKFWYKHLGILVKLVGLICAWFFWIKSLVWSEEELYLIKYKTTVIKTLVSPDPRTVSDWCKDLTKQIKQEGVARAGSVCVFIPRVVNKKDKQVSTTSCFSYLVVFVPPDNCLLVAFSDEHSIPEPVSKLLCMSKILFYVESLSKLRKSMHHHCVYKWSVPGNIRCLAKLFKSRHPSEKAGGLTFLNMADKSIRDFTYRVPRWVIASNWGKSTLRQKEVQYLTMRCYSGYLCASQMRFTMGSFLIKDLAKKTKEPLSDSEASVPDDSE